MTHLGGFLCFPPSPPPPATQRPGRGPPQAGEQSQRPVLAEQQAGVCLRHTLISVFFVNSWPALGAFGTGRSPKFS